MTASALGRDSDIFKAGVDMHGVHDWSMFAEDWFGKPLDRYQMPDMAELRKTFWLSSPDSVIGTWKAPVLLIQPISSNGKARAGTIIAAPAQPPSTR